ncbi:MAG: hypothetical protein ACT443_00225 [Gemmatimonadota bacterium]
MDLATYLGPAVEAVSGRVLGTAPDSLVLAITAVDTRRLGENYWNGERVALARESIESMTQKHLSTKRTALFSALVLAGGYALLRAFDIDFRSGDEGVPMPPPQQ